MTALSTLGGIVDTNKDYIVAATAYSTREDVYLLSGLPTRCASFLVGCCRSVACRKHASDPES
jgi:hypothetical protein